jgi:hypothetical protein
MNKIGGQPLVYYAVFLLSSFDCWFSLERNELEGRVLRVVTLEDRKTIHNAFPDRGYKP